MSHDRLVSLRREYRPSMLLFAEISSATLGAIMGAIRSPRRRFCRLRQDAAALDPRLPFHHPRCHRSLQAWNQQEQAPPPAARTPWTSESTPTTKGWWWYCYISLGACFTWLWSQIDMFIRVIRVEMRFVVKQVFPTITVDNTIACVTFSAERAINGGETIGDSSA